MNLTEFILSARRRADMLEASFISDVEVTEYLNLGISRLHSMLSSYEGAYLAAKSGGLPQLDPDGSPGWYELPLDVYKVLAVYFMRLGEQPQLLRTRELAEYNAKELGEPRYTLRPPLSDSGMFIEVSPTSATDVISVEYVPKAKKLAWPGDTYETIGGWEDYAVLFAARRMLSKEESSTRGVDEDMKMLEEAIAKHAHRIDHGMPPRISEVV